MPPNKVATLYALLERNAGSFPDRTAVEFRGERVSYAGLLDRVNALAGGLAALGLKKGDPVCVLAQNHPAYLELFGAASLLGLVLHPLNWRLTTEELGLIVQRAAPRMMIVDEAALEKVAGWPKEHPAIEHWFQWEAASGDGFSSWEELFAPQGSSPPVAEKAGREEPFMVIATAAVDVVPRGAMLSQSNLLAANRFLVSGLDLKAGDVNLVTLPLFHIAALSAALAFFQAGGCNLVMSRFDAGEAAALIPAGGVTHFVSFPPVLGQVLDLAAEGGHDLSGLRMVIGLEGPETVERLEKHTGAEFFTGFGQSETSGFITLGGYRERPGSAGRPGPETELRLEDDYGREVPAGEPGEICVKGAMVFSGYHTLPEVTAHTFRGGWHHTGDVGRLDQDGYLYYVKRKPEKELIKPGGENVYPAEVEAVIMELEQVSAVCVFGVPDSKWGEAVRAVVEVTDGARLTLTGEAVIGHVAGRIARYKKPQEVFITDRLPRDDSGSVNREAVREKWG
ncbi:MAG: AMP-binding protein [Deltaproteobacteria bacterium]|nr:AMP-binding protein [Deltaproteobacteria bacterium]